ncbi:Asp/Glu racemase [Phytophthora cactorum]|nr:Asp/Glu racemase [Phytophthora cactorum]
MVCPAPKSALPAPGMESPVALKVKKVKTTKPEEVMLGICGGVGPAAGLLLHQLILQNTDSAGKDQGHLNVCHFSRSEDMTDRTEYLVYAANSSFDATDSDSDSGLRMVENPACGMARTFAMMHAAPLQEALDWWLAIWDEFIRQQVMRVMCIIKQVPSCKRVGLMSTTGTRKSRVYHDLLEPRGYTVVEVNAGAMQQALHNRFITASGE